MLYLKMIFKDIKVKFHSSILLCPMCWPHSVSFKNKNPRFTPLALPTKYLCILASTFMVPFLHKYFTVVQKMHYILCKFSILIKFIFWNCIIYIWFLIGTNLLNNISTKASEKIPYLMPNYYFLVQISCTHFSWV